MATEFVQSGYIEVWRDEEMVSRHRVEREAVESALADSENRDSGEYELRFPVVRIIVKRPITQPNAPALGAVYALSTTSLGVPLDRPATGPTTIEEYVLERRLYGATSFTEIARGLAIFGAANVYTDTGLTAGTQYEYRCKAIDTTARESEWCAPAFGETTSSAEIYEPIGVSAVAIAGGIRVSWSAPASGLAPDSYEIQRTYSATGTWNVIGSQAGTTYDDPVGDGVSKWYRIVSLNGANRSAASAVVTATGGTGANTQKRWNPGHYIKTQGTDSRTDQQNYWSQVLGEMDRAASFTPMKGAFVNVAWGSFNTTGSTYDWSYLDSLFDYADSLGQKLIVAATYKNFRPSTVGLICPADLTASQTYSTVSGWITAIWRPAVMNRFIAACEAFADRYASRPALEAFSWSESAPSWASVTPPADYSRAALSTQLNALVAATAPMFPNSWVQCCLNSLSGEMTQMVNAAFLAGAGFSTPDAVDTNAVRLFRGETVTGEQQPIYGDLRGRMMHEQIASSPVLGGKDDNGPATNIIDWAQANDVTHLCWVTSVSSTGNTWADIQAAITADPLLHETYPTG